MQLADAGAGTRFEAARRTAGAVSRTLESTFAVETLALGDTLVAVRRSHVAGWPPLRPRGRDRRRARPPRRTPARGGRARVGRRRHVGQPRRGCAPAAGVHARRPAPPRRRPIARCWRSTSATRCLTDSVVELSATIGARGFRGEPVEVRVVENGRAVHVRRVSPPADGTALTERFRVSPSLDGPSVYNVEVAVGAGRADHRPTTGSRCWCARRDGPGRCCSSRARPATSTASSSARGSWIAASRSTRWCARGATTRAARPTTSRRRAAAPARWSAASRRRARRCSATTPSRSPTSAPTCSARRSSSWSATSSPSAAAAC